jgi:glucan 1,3-beta-glucosidase
MVSPTKGRANAPSPLPADAQYSAVPAGEPSPNNSPNPNDPYSNLSGNALPESAFLSPDQPDVSLLGRHDSTLYPAPSIISRDSTHASLSGTPSLRDNRASWGSGTALAAAEAGIAGADVSISSLTLCTAFADLPGKETERTSRSVKPSTLDPRLEQHLR